MAAGSTYAKVATVTIGSSQANYTFSSITGGYTDLILIINGTGSGDAGFQIQFNGDTGSNYGTTYLYNTASGSTSGTNITSMGRISTSNATSVIQFANYSSTSVYKNVIGRGSSASSLVIAAYGIWKSNSAITSIKLTPESSNTISTGTTLTLYGIAAA